jgi:DNA-binding NtrC family response regulator
LLYYQEVLMAQSRVVLVVEDDRDCRETFMEILQDSGYAAYGARNVEDALVWVECYGDPTVVLLDYIMPRFNGSHFVASYRGKAPIILMSASSRLLREHPVFRFLAKPFNVDTLLSTIEDAIQSYY